MCRSGRGLVGSHLGHKEDDPQSSDLLHFYSRTLNSHIIYQSNQSSIFLGQSGEGRGKVRVLGGADWM